MKREKGTPSASATDASADLPVVTRSSTFGSAPGPPFTLRYSTATITSAKARAAASCEGSLAIDGCICSKVMSLSCFAASLRSAAEKGESASPPEPRQRVSAHLAMPSCSQMGVLFWVRRVTTWCTYSCAAVSSQS
jgi:hypothetical protein